MLCKDVIACICSFFSTPLATDTSQYIYLHVGVNSCICDLALQTVHMIGFCRLVLLGMLITYNRSHPHCVVLTPCRLRPREAELRLKARC